MRPHPIDVSRSRSKSPSRMFKPTTPRSIMSHILQPRKSETTHLTKSEETTHNALFQTAHKEKILTPYGLVEPKTPPGPPPYIKQKPIIKRLVIKKQNK